MAWKSGRQKEKASNGTFWMLIMGLIILASVGACSITHKEQAARPPKLTLMEETAMIQARWEASAKARQEVRP